MKNFFFLVLGVAMFGSCSKNKGTVTPTKPLIDNTKPGGLVNATITVTDNNLYAFAVTEYDANTKALVMHKDTEIRGNFNYQFYPHVNNTVLEEVDISQALPTNFHLAVTDAGMALTDFNQGVDYTSINFTAK